MTVYCSAFIWFSLLDGTKAIRTSQPAATRLRIKLEKEGIIREYTMIPEFSKIGYHLLGLTFVKLKKTLGANEVDRARKITKERVAESRFGIVMLERGLGLGYDGVIVACYKDYSDFSNHKKVLRDAPFLEISEMESFLINFDDEVRYRPSALKSLASLLLKIGNPQ